MALVPRLFLISHASTDAQRAVAFPRDEPVSGRGRRELLRATAPVADVALTAPELRTIETATALGLSPTVEPLLRDMDFGRWAGTAMEEIPAASLAVWLADPEAAPHGGESIHDVIVRTGTWLASLMDSPERIVAVTHAAVVRAAMLYALGAPASAFRRIDVRPLAVTRLDGKDGRWNLRLG
ncbi:histidine phosphatase family protein [Rhodococcus sp. (in: high G+C Gram-positive bacteria)]|uniref:histidine phosphatase family protein n=1 Tax=Rhodococcus sp. TaxID=1831 RepID=UPI003890CB04